MWRPLGKIENRYNHIFLFCKIAQVFKLLVVLLLAAWQPLLAQTIQTDEALAQRYPFLRRSQHFLRQSESLESFFRLLRDRKANGQRTVQVVHIGDSHIQPDFFGAMLRQGLQLNFGNAGRGLTFPYQLALSNSPDDISVQSGTSWKFNRLAHPEIDLPYGISGYGIVADSNRDLRLRFTFRGPSAARSSFSNVRLFGNFIWGNPWAVLTDSGDTLWFSEELNYPDRLAIRLPDAQTDLEIWSPAGSEQKALFGIEFTNDSIGLLYHAIGVNGARVDHYLEAGLFWQQLPALAADLYIVSLGTNDIQVRRFNKTAWEEDLKSLVQKLRASSPAASILFTTVPESYQYRRINPHLRQLNESLLAFCAREQVACYDLHTVMSGVGTAHRSRALKLLQKDRVHYTAEGYRLMGNLLVNAILSAFEETPGK